MTMPVFVNDRCITVSSGATAEAAAILADPTWAGPLGDGRAHLTDGRGIRIDGSALVSAGSILRVVKTARRPAEAPDADG